MIRHTMRWVAQLQAAELANEAGLIRLQGAQRVKRVRLHQAPGGSFEADPASPWLRKPEGASR